jgi:pilus assembly protein CpaE
MEGRKGTIFTVFSTAYAVGKTLIAINIAAELAHQGRKVCLVDLDLQFGDLCYYLKLSPKLTIADAQRAMKNNPNDVSVVEYLTTWKKGNVQFEVLANPRLMEEAYNMEVDVIRNLVQQLQLEFDYVIIDTTSTFSALNLAMMDLSTIINFVGIVDFIPTIKNMKRGSDTLKEMGYDDNKIRYILNRSNAKTRIDVEDVESILGKHFDYVLPNDFQTASNSVRSGVPFVIESRNTTLARELASIVDGYGSPAEPLKQANQDKGKEEQGGWLSRLFS